MVYDVLVVGGGPAGSTCARFLTRGGARVALVDRADFPRVKLCGGWLSAPIWDVLELAPTEYSGGLWRWQTCHVRYGGVNHAVAVPRLLHSSLRVRRFSPAPQRRRAEPRHLGAGDRARQRRALGGGGRCGRATWSAPPAPIARSRAGTRRRVPSARSASRSTSFAPTRRRSRARAWGRTASPSCCCTTISAATPGTSPRPTG